jgi:hypothetical protein
MGAADGICMAFSARQVSIAYNLLAVVEAVGKAGCVA